MSERATHHASPRDEKSQEQPPGLVVELEGLNGEPLSEAGTYVVGEPFRGAAMDSAGSTRQTEPDDELVEFARRSIGQFLVLRREGAGCEVATDHLGFVPLYLVRTRSGIALSNDLQHLARRFALRLSRAGIAETLSTREGFTWSTELFEGVERVAGATVVSVRPAAHVTSATYTHLPPPSTPEVNDSAGAMAALDAALAIATSAASQPGRTVFDLTGGYDTRQIVAALDRARPSSVGRVVTSGTDEDSQRAIELAEDVGLEFAPHKVSPKTLLQFHLAYHCTRARIVDDYYRYSGHDLHLCGMGGSELMHAETAAPDPDRLVRRILSNWELSPSIKGSFVDLPALRAAQRSHLEKGLYTSIESAAADPFADFWARLFVRRFHGQLFERALLAGCRLTSPYLLSPFFYAMVGTPRGLKLDRALSKRWLAGKGGRWLTSFSAYPLQLSLPVSTALSGDELEALSDHDLINPVNWNARRSRRDSKETLRWRGIARYLMDGFPIG